MRASSSRRPASVAVLLLSVAALTAPVACGDDPAPATPGPGGGAGGAAGASGSAGVSGGGSAGASGAPSGTLSPAVGAFRLEITKNERLTISAPEGRILFEGLAPSTEVGQGYAATDADPPMTGFATREVVRTSTMLFGSFKHDEEAKGPWRIAKTLRPAVDGKSVDVLDDAGAKLATMAIAQGDDEHHLVVDITPGEGKERRFSWGVKCNPEDHFQGFGAQTWGVDARGESIPVWVGEQGILKDLTTDDPKGAWYSRGRRHSSYLPMPEFLSSRGYFAVAETDTISTFAMCSEREDVMRLQLELPVKLHLFEGATSREALTRKTAHFGRSRIPPSFAFAPWNDAIFGSAEVRRVAKVIRDNKIPSSVIWSEDWRGGEDSATIKDGYALLEEWDLDRKLYPDFEALAGELHGAGFKWMVYFNPFVEKISKAWPETEPKGWLVKKGDVAYEFDDAKFLKSGLIDLTNPEANAWAVGKMKTSITLGADGWMGDFSEWLPTDSTLAGGTGEQWHNKYPVLWQKAQREAMDTVGDGVERLSFVRTGWFGTPGLADVFWAGDQSTDFREDDGMPTIIPMGIGVGLSGISTYGHDIGGYNTLSTEPTTKEVFFRWTELGAWSPVMRTHHGTAPRVSWTFDKDAETLAHWKRYTELHVSLAPYWQTLAQIAHDTGIPIWRSLALDFGAETQTWGIKDQVMVGDGILLAPVQAKGAVSRSVYFPKGGWYAWNEGQIFEGGQTLTVDAALGEVPVFARAGTLVPTYPVGVETLVKEASSAPAAASAGDSRVLYAFAGNGSFAEAGGGSYTMSSAGAAFEGDIAVTWGGVPLTTCDAAFTAPCVEAGSLTVLVRAHVTGPGALVVKSGGRTWADISIANVGAASATTAVVRF